MTKTGKISIFYPYPDFLLLLSCSTYITLLVSGVSSPGVFLNSPGNKLGFISKSSQRMAVTAGKLPDMVYVEASNSIKKRKNVYMYENNIE